MNAVERLWVDGRRRARSPFDTRRPGNTVTDVLLALAGGPSYGAAIARTSGRAQSEVTRVLARLGRFGFVAVVEMVPGLGCNGGGKPAVMWALTPAGRALVAALRAEMGVSA